MQSSGIRGLKETFVSPGRVVWGSATVLLLGEAERSGVMLTIRFWWVGTPSTFCEGALVTGLACQPRSLGDLVAPLSSFHVEISYSHLSYRISTRVVYATLTTWRLPED